MLQTPSQPKPKRAEPQSGGEFTARLLAWYDRHARELPWRIGPDASKTGVRADPYRVWLSEIMLQQTTVSAVKAYFEKFTRLWPDVSALAAASNEDVMKAWAGLGYYSRARNLKAAADFVAGQLGGQFPQDEAGLSALPGIGAYASAAIAAIAFGKPAIVIDGNAERVMARQLALPNPPAKAEIRAALAPLVPAGRPGDFAQAMMDLGAMICRPKNPDCAACPVSSSCAGLAQGDAARYPLRAAKAPKPQRSGACYVIFRDDGAVLLRKRPAKGLLGGMSEPPGWGDEPAPFGLKYRPCGAVVHVFTHFRLELAVHRHDSRGFSPPNGYWWAEDPDAEALPSLFQKAIRLAQQS